MSTAVAVKENPLLMTVPFATMAWQDLKTVTRRPIEPQPTLVDGKTWEWPEKSVYDMKRGLTKISKASWAEAVNPTDCMARFCPHGQPGERLWVRTTWFHHKDKKNPKNEHAWDEVTKTVRWKDTGQVIKNATPDTYDKKWWKKRPSIHMNRWASGQVYDILEVRAERLREISEEDAKAEGVRIPVTTEGCPPGKGKPMFNLCSPFFKTHDISKEECPYRVQFAFDWDQLYGGPLTWSKNPWVWVISFRRARV